MTKRRMSSLGRMLVTILMLAGCRSHDDLPAPPASFQPAPATPPPAVALDQARPGELAEGTEIAFGLPVPRKMMVSARFPDTVFAYGQLPAESVANYVRDRVIAEHVETGPAKTVFTGATVKSAPQHVVRIEVTLESDRTELMVRDLTKPPAKDGLTEEERWRELGLDPKGQPLDPTHLQ